MSTPPSHQEARSLGVLAAVAIVGLAFFAAALGSLALALGVREATRGSWGSRLGSALVGLYGVGLILAGVFPTDEIDPAGRVETPTIVGAIHIVVSALAFVFGIAGMFVLSRTFKRDARWRPYWPVSLALSFVALIGFFLQNEGPWVGLSQRLFIGTVFLWQVLVAFWLRSIAKGASASNPRGGARALNFRERIFQALA